MAFLGDIQGFSKEGLNPTETVETHTLEEMASREYPEDDEEVFSAKLKKVVGLFQNAKYVGFFSGAGISASAGVATFQGKGKLNSLLNLREEHLDLLFPTYAHMACQALIEDGKAKFVVSSNHDNFHRKAGTTGPALAEIFGNAYVEACMSGACGHQAVRSVVCPPTGRVCERCGTKMKKTGVRYGQAVPEAPLKLAWNHAEKADLAIVLGSGMHTGPFNEMPPLADNMVVVNLGPTGADRKAAVKVNSSCDRFMRALCKAVGVVVPNHIYTQEGVVGYTTDGEYCTFFLRGSRINEPCTAFGEVQITYNGLTKDLDKNNLTYDFVAEQVRLPPGASVHMTLFPQEEYAEAPVEVDFVIQPNGATFPVQFRKVVAYAA